MDYYEIGQKIRKYRKALGYSQEELANKVGISTTHMSHIETGNTKLSLGVLVDLATALEAQTDDLLFPPNEIRKSKLEEEILQEVSDCSSQQLNILLDILRAAKKALNKHL